MTRAEENKALVRRLVEIVNGRDLDALEEVASGRVDERASRWIGPFLDSFPDFRMDVVDVIAEADKVVGYFKCSGTHAGEWRGIPPAGDGSRTSTRSTSLESRTAGALRRSWWSKTTWRGCSN